MLIKDSPPRKKNKILFDARVGKIKDLRGIKWSKEAEAWDFISVQKSWGTGKWGE